MIGDRLRVREGDRLVEVQLYYHRGSSPLPERVILVFAALGVIKYGLGANHMPPPLQVCVFIEDLSEEFDEFEAQVTGVDHDAVGTKHHPRLFTVSLRVMNGRSFPQDLCSSNLAQYTGIWACGSDSILSQ